MAKKKNTPGSIGAIATQTGHAATQKPPVKGVLRPAPKKGIFRPGVTQGAPGTHGPAVTPQPYDPAVDQAALIGDRNVAVTNGNAAWDTGNLSFEFGLNPDGTVNTANPYSRAALYQLAYTNSKRGTLNSMAARGQLYSGALGNAQNLNDANYARNDAANRLAYSRGIHGIQAGQLSAYANAGSGVSGADFKSLLNSVYPTGS